MGNYIFFYKKKKRSDVLTNKIKCLFYFFKLNYKKQSQKNKIIINAILIILESNKYNDLDFFQNHNNIIQTCMNLCYSTEFISFDLIRFI